MENHCASCFSSYSPMLDTWTQKSSLRTSNFDPFKNMGWTNENYAGNYASLSSSWTRGCNITPDNSPTYNTYTIKSTKSSAPHKEKFSLNSNNTYARSNRTWVKQGLYTSN